MTKFSRIVMTIVACGLMLAFLAPPIWKLKEVDMGIILLIGLVMMIVSAIEAIREKDD
jgi:hypothetical protein